MRSFAIPPSDLRARVLSALANTVLFLVLFALLDRIFLRHSFDPIAMAAGGVVYAALTFWQSGKEWTATVIEVDAAEIRLVREGAVKRTVSKDRICYVREGTGNFFRRPMVVISERGWWGHVCSVESRCRRACLSTNR